MNYKGDHILWLASEIILNINTLPPILTCLEKNNYIHKNNYKITKRQGEKYF